MNSKKTPRYPRVWHALISMSVVVIMLVIGIVKYHVDPHIPMFVGVIGAAIMALILGYEWSDIQDSMIEGIRKSMSSIIILMLIGILIGTWINAGIVPAMIYYGLFILKPSIFFVAAVLICSITSLATGTSWGTMGTMGVALMGIGAGLGLNPGMTAGAILSGAYFGDKMSPLSDTTNLAPAMAGTDVISHVKFMLKPTAICYGITLIFFAVLSFVQIKEGSADMSSVLEIRKAIASNFNVNPLLFIPPLLVIILVSQKMPAIPGLTIGVISGAVLGLIFQNDCNLGTLFDCSMNGYVSETGVKSIDNLLSSGGLMNMMSSIGMTMIAMMFGGIMEHTHQLEVIVNKIKKLAKSNWGLVTVTEFTCLLSDALMPEQYVSIVIPGRMYAEEYKKRNLTPTTLSNALESSGTVVSALIPWNTCGVFIAGTLGITVSQYLPWAVFNWMMPIMNLILAAVGITIAKNAAVNVPEAQEA